MIPLWALFGLGVAVTSAGTMLLQEKFQVEGLKLAVWCKIACILTMMPFVMMYGLPDNPVFYILLFFQGLMFAIADVIFYRSLPVIGAGVISRLMPTSIILSFLLWFIFDPQLLITYAATPYISLAILAVFVMTVYFGLQLKRCTISMSALKIIWFVIFANTIGAILAKIIMAQATPLQGPFGFTFAEAWMMLGMWLIYILKTKPFPLLTLFEKKTMIPGLTIGIVMSCCVVLLVSSYNYIDNPGYISAIRILDTVIIIGAHYLIGKKDTSNKVAGIGLVACAICLMLLKD